MTPTVTPIYAALLTLLYLILSARVVTYRRGNKVSLGDQGDPVILKRIRVHANFAEYAPLGLVLLLLAELQGAPALALHLLGLVLLAGRAIHAFAVSQTPQIMAGRVAGMVLTFSMLIVSALGLLTHALL